MEMDTNVVNIKSLSMLTLKCIKQHISNIWSSTHEKPKRWDWVVKSVAYKK